MQLATVVVKLFIAYLRQAEACERQARIVKSKSKRQGFLDSAGQWARLAAEAERCEALAPERTEHVAYSVASPNQSSSRSNWSEALKRQSFECNKKPQRAL
jgi:hypothetical protein